VTLHKLHYGNTRLPQKLGLQICAPWMSQGLCPNDPHLHHDWWIRKLGIHILHTQRGGKKEFFMTWHVQSRMCKGICCIHILQRWCFGKCLTINNVWLLLPIIPTPSCCKIDYCNIILFPTEGKRGMWGWSKAKIVKALKGDSANSFCYCNEGAHCKNQQDVFDLHA
jgi:hypothetical protein